MIAQIYKPSQNMMQSGVNGNNKWKIDFPRQQHGSIDPLTGTSSSIDMLQKVKLNFATKELAIAYAKSKGFAYQVMERGAHKPVGRSYGDNFAYERKFPWTH